MKPAIALVALFISACTGSGFTVDPPEPPPPPDGGEWGARAGLIENDSEFVLAEANGKLYVLGGYPPAPDPDRTARTVQIYDIASDRWELGPRLPQPNNHGMAAAVNGKIYLIGGQTTDDQQGATAVDTVYELDPAKGAWVEKAPMPTARSGGGGPSRTAARSTSPGDAVRRGGGASMRAHRARTSSPRASTSPSPSRSIRAGEDRGAARGADTDDRGRGGINGYLLRVGLIDELSLLLAPVADGRIGTPALFDANGENVMPHRLVLVSVERRADDVLWLRYRVERP